MKLLSPLPHKKARIEIIPLIDIMFFLLACMMLVSLNMVEVKGLHLSLPTAATATPENRSDFVTLSVKQDGSLYIDKVPITRSALVDELKQRKAAKPDLRIYIQGDAGALHGDVISVLDKVRAAGIQKVAFQIKADSGDAAPAQTQASASAPEPVPAAAEPAAAQ